MPTVLEFVQAAKGLHEKLVRMMAEGLGLESEAFLRRLLTPEIRIRGKFYPLLPEGTEVGPNLPHSDPFATTLLCDTASGLEVISADTWVQVQSVPNGFIVNVGNQIEILSNGKFKSIRHRAGRNENKERLSLACFCSPENDAVIAPLEEMLVNGQQPKYRTVRYADYFKSFVTKGVNECKISEE
ncbi:hypothetical protein R1sor_019238 [Riccia sorocarpa]|uniref:Fe2OG dioxygenase domain-containing protein n=1 Tax=Riccia sorocarpa TaxID=122646 RepID=A0ABD3IG38_9MARC